MTHVWPDRLRKERRIAHTSSAFLYYYTLPSLKQKRLRKAQLLYPPLRTAAATSEGRSRWICFSGEVRLCIARDKSAFCASSKRISVKIVGVLGHIPTNLALCPHPSSETPRKIGGEVCYCCDTSLLPAAAKVPTRSSTRRHTSAWLPRRQT